MSISSEIRDELGLLPIKPLCCRRAYLYGLIYCAEVEDTTLDVSLMCDRALLALQSVKNNFTNRVAWYNGSMRDALIEEQELAAEMVAALENGQFEVFYQPQYDYDNNVLHGAEALVRWRHPQKGLIAPSGFIPFFERNGFISRLDEFVWRTVCINIRKWKEMGLPVVPISVNISRIDLYNPRLCETLIGMIESNGLDSSMLRLEITESAYMYDPDQLVRTVENLRSAGFSVEMDEALRGCLVPKLLLQPLVENAIYHGIKLKGGSGQIRIRIKPHGEDMSILVADNGPGMTAERLRAVRRALAEEKHSMGFGLCSMTKRLRLTYGEPYGASVYSIEGKGTAVRLLLPRHTEKR